MPVFEDDFVNPVRSRIDAGGVALGISIQLAKTAGIASVAKVSDHDFLYVDMQHAMFEPGVASEIAQACAARGIAAVARVRSADDPNIAVLLDCGYHGIVAPDVESGAQAEALVRATKYAPIGSRSVGGFLASVHTRNSSLPDYLGRANRRTLVFCMIESQRGLAVLDEVAAVAGLDGVYLGMTDLMADLGAIGQPDAPEAVAAVDAVVRATRAHGRIAGAGGFASPDRAVDAIRRGVRFINTNSDLGYIMDGAARTATRFREAL